MPVTLKLTFPGGRYHATPWGRHVNEGVPEWPPSPWRLLRALVAVWKRTCADIPEEQVKRVFTALATPPRFRLPASTVAHTRHYMPWEKKGPADRTLVFDTFVAVGRKDGLLVNWPDATLRVEDEAALRRLAGNLTSFGRSEGWVEAEVQSFPEAGDPPTWNCTPAPPGTPGELVPVLCPDPASAFASDHYPPVPTAAKLKKGLKADELLFDCPRWHLCLDTQTIHAEKWPRVPGATWVNYTAPTAAPPAAPKVTARPRPNQPTVARFLLDGPVLPLVTDTVAVAEAVRRALMGRFNRWCEKHPNDATAFRRPDAGGKYSSGVFSGKTLAGEVRTDHGHAHYLPTAEGDDPRRVTHVTVWAEDGFGPGDTAALTGLRDVTARDRTYRVQLVGLGKPADFTSAVFGASTTWVSQTPFVAHRHVKRRGTKRDTPHLTGPDPTAAFVELAVRELIARRGIGELVSVSPHDPGGATPRAFEYRRGREKAADTGWNRPFGFVRLSFESAVCGPVCLGYASHYGLGLFRPPAAETSPRAARS